MLVATIAVAVGCSSETTTSTTADDDGTISSNVKRTPIIAFARGGSDPGIHLLLLDEGRTVRVTRGDDHSPAWSPSGRQLAYISGRASKSAEVYVGDFDDESLQLSGARKIADTAAALAWAPDGKRMVLAAIGGLRIVDVSSGDSRPTGADDLFESLSWPVDDVIYASSAAGVFRLTFRAGDWEQSTTGRPYDGDAAGRPDETLALSRAIGSPAELVRSLYVGENGKLRRLTTARTWDSRPSWSPDGKQLVFTRFPLRDDGYWAGPPDLFVVDTRSGEVSQLTKNDFPDLDPSWRPRNDVGRR